MSKLDSCSFSDKLAAYLVGETTLEAFNEMNDHLAVCPSCREELNEMQEAWDLIPFNLEEVEVPSDLKAEVMNAIFTSETKVHLPSNKKQQVHFKKMKKSLLGIVAAVFLVSCIGLIWSNLTLKKQLMEIKDQEKFPTKVYTLKSANPAMDSTHGSALLYKQGNMQQLVFHFHKLPETNGSEAYQVWLIHNGKRKSAGIVQVDKQGNGFLTFKFKENEVKFEAIGVSLEPDSTSKQPRGKKVLGT